MFGFSEARSFILFGKSYFWALGVESPHGEAISWLHLQSKAAFKLNVGRQPAACSEAVRAMPIFEEKLISPLAVRFTQEHIRTTFRDGRLVDASIEEIKVSIALWEVLWQQVDMNTKYVHEQVI